MKKVTTLLVVATALFAWSIQVHAFSGRTHEELTKTAIFKSSLDEYLRNQLEIDQGLYCVLLLNESITPDPDRILPGVPANPFVLDLLKAGSRLEDIPLPRARHHFHDPYRDTGLDNKTQEGN